ncbi:MAG: glycosyltransferase family 4 protein [Oscillospiraceae bacterium]
MNVLIISQYYYPDSFRINDIAEELVKQGHNVKVVTGLPDYANSVIPKEYKFFKKRHEIINGVEIVRVPTLARRKGVLFRMLNYTSFMISSVLYATFCSKKNIDVIFSYQTSPIFQVYPAIKFKKSTKKELIVYCCDLWPESLKAWGIQESSFIYKKVKKISTKIYNKADKVAITSKPFRKYLNDVCDLPDEKMVYLPQHCEDMYSEIVGEYQENDCIDFVFAGNIGSVQNVDCIIKATKEIKTNKKFIVHIVGNGSELDNLKALAKELDIQEKIVFHGRHPAEKMIDFYKMADCTLLTLRGGDFIGSTLPAKCQTYLSLGKPIVGAIDGAGYEVIKESDCGDCVAANDYKNYAIIMQDVIENFDKYKQKGINGRRYYEENFTKEIFMNDFIKIISE